MAALLHHVAREAQDSARSAETVFRLRYELAPTDPRFLEATEEEIYRDLLTLHFLGEDMRSALDPEREDIERIARDPRAAAALLRRKSEALRDATLAAGLRAVTGRGKAGEDAAPGGSKGPKKLRLRRSSTKEKLTP